MLNPTIIEYCLTRAKNVLGSRYSLAESSDCLLRLLFYKRLSDLSPENHSPLSIPKEFRWSNVTKTDRNLGEALDESLEILEQIRPELEGIFTDSEGHFWSRFDDATLGEIITILSELRLNEERADIAFLLSQAVENLIEQNAELYTPQQITALMVALLNPSEENTIYDPACRFGEFLVEAASFISQQEGNSQSLRIYGQGSDPKSAMTKINLMMHGIDSSEIISSNVIEDPGFVQENVLKQFDIVLTNPPFGKKYDVQNIRNYKFFDRFSCGTLHTVSGELLFIQHVLKSLQESGKAAILLPRGILSKEGGEGRIRSKIIENDCIEAVIELAPKLFYNAVVPVVVVVFNRSKLNKKTILFIDASCEYKKEKQRNILEPEHVDRILKTYRNFHEEEGFSKIVSIEKIAKNGYNLNVNRYIIPPANEQVDVDLEVEKLRLLEDTRSELEDRIDHYLQSLGIKSL
jgi:type I restriction enzyme M protein